jgi:hypothetical protein
MILWGTGQAASHEVIPAVADFNQNGKQITIEIRMTSEAIIAGIDLSQVTDTNASDKSATYDELRALDRDILAAKFTEIWPQFEQTMTVAQNDQRLPLTLTAVRVDPIGNTDIARYTYVTIGAQTSGQGPVTFQWAAQNGDIVLRQMGVENGLTQLLQNGATSDPMLSGGSAVAVSGWATFVSYIPVGFDHILPKGLDHILFVLGLFFLSAGLGALIWQISAFTLAHTITLAAGALGWVTISGAIVEPLIAASIVFVAVENILSNRLNTWRPVVIFAFGLLHGLGFASVLGEFGLPQSQFIPALIGFNIGVEIGQLTVIAIAFAAVGLWFGRKPWYRARIAVPASCVIALIGAYWFVERVFL